MVPVIPQLLLGDNKLISNLILKSRQTNSTSFVYQCTHLNINSKISKRQTDLTNTKLFSIKFSNAYIKDKDAILACL